MLRRFLISLQFILLAPCLAHAADRIVLRDLTIINDKRVVAMTLEGARLDDGKILGWGEIETGRLDGGRQELFDKYVANVGVHLFRIRQRLENGDYRSLSPSAEAIAKYYRGRDSATAYMVMQALMWGRMAEGRRAAAVAPFLSCFEYLRGHPKDAAPPPGRRRLKYDAATGLCDELPPIWFDAQAAKAALPEVAAAINAMQEPRPAATRIYYASLAVAAGDKQAADRALEGVGDEPPRLAELKTILQAQREIAAGAPGEKTEQLSAAWPKMTDANRPLARYLLGLAKLSSDDEKTRMVGVLDLLYLPALYGAASPELAAAGLFQAMQALEKMGDVRGSVAVRNELLEKYGQTYHAAQVAADASE